MTSGKLLLFILLTFGLVACAAPTAIGPAQPDLRTYAANQAADKPVNSIAYASLVAPDSTACQVQAMDLLGAWVDAKSPEKDTFPFTSIDGKTCSGTYPADIAPLFSQANLWYAGALSCRSCHGPDVTLSYARLDLSSFAGIIAGSGRASADKAGEDILGGGEWQKSVLYDVLSKGEMPPARPPGTNPKGPLVYAGTTN